MSKAADRGSILLTIENTPHRLCLTEGKMKEILSTYKMAISHFEG